MILTVAFANPRACNIFGFRERMRIEAERNDKGILYVKAPKTGAAMRVKENGGRMFIRSMSGQDLVTFKK